MTASETATPRPLQAPLEPGFDYTRSLGDLLGRFMAGLRERRVFGAPTPDGRVHVPPPEYDPLTADPVTELVEVGTEGTVVTWSWMPNPIAGQPLEKPFAWALVRLDGADTAMLHAVDVTAPGRMRTGMRVRIRWAAERTGSITDIACFEPVTGEPGGGESQQPPVRPGPAEPVEGIVTPVHLSYQHSASPEESRYLRGLAEGRLLGQRCPRCEKVYIPPRGACPTDGVPTEKDVELPDSGIVTTFCVVNVPFMGQRITPPYVAAYILLDGADIAFLHLVLGCPADEVRMGMRVAASWKPREQWWTSLENIDHFEPTGGPDAPYESYSQHL